MTNLNELKTKLIDLSHRSRVAQAVFLNWAGRLRSRQSMEPNQMYNRLRNDGVSITRSELQQLLRELNGIGIGQLNGRRFDWNYTLRSVGSINSNPNGQLVPFKGAILAHGVLKQRAVSSFTVEHDGVIVKISPQSNMSVRQVFETMAKIFKEEAK